jgi:hypothetical protein
MRKALLTAFVLATGAVAATAQSEPFPGSMTNTVASASKINEAGRFGVGFMLGEPMGVTAKVWVNDFVAVDAGLGWSFEDPDGTQLHADALFHKFDPFKTELPDLAIYAGVGGRLKFPEHGDTHFGFRFPIGVAYMLPQNNLEFYAEVAPILDVTPSVRIAWNGGVGVRYYFK